MQNKKSYRLENAISRASRQICGCWFLPKIGLARAMMMVGRSDGCLCCTAGEVGRGLAEAALLGQVHQKKKHQNEQHPALHLGLCLPPGVHIDVKPVILKRDVVEH
jgi:hypothetical protein